MLRMDDYLISSLLSLLTESLPCASRCLSTLQAGTPPVLTSGPWEGHFYFMIALSQTWKLNQKEVRQLLKTCRHGPAKPGSKAGALLTPPRCPGVCESHGHGTQSHDWLQMPCSLKFQAWGLSPVLYAQEAWRCRKRLSTQNAAEENTVEDWTGKRGNEG